MSNTSSSNRKNKSLSSLTKNRVIYSGFTNKYSRRIVENLSSKFEWEPVYILGIDDDDEREWVKTHYKGCELQNSMTLRQAQFNYKNLNEPEPIDAKIIDALSKYALNYMSFLNDTTGWNYSFSERKLFYYDMLKYWNTVIKTLNPNLMVSFTRPHTPSELALYLLCKHYYDINVLYIDPTPLFNRHYHIIGTSIHDLSEPFISIYESNAEVKIGQGVSDYLKEVRSEKSSVPKYILHIYKKDKENTVPYLVHFLKIIVKSIICGGGSKLGLSDWKNNRCKYTSLDSRMNSLENQIFLHHRALKNIRLKRTYNAICEEADFFKKYVYFPASYQPEAATSINGGAYEEIFIVLDILSAAIPDDWLIYYKEHPYTFMKYSNGALIKNKYFYEKVMGYRNIVIIPSNTDSFKLVDNSQAVASMAGTAVWESVVRGKPAISFGNAWHSKCKSIFDVYTLKDCINAINKIIEGYLPDQNDIERYAASIEKVAIKGMVHRKFHEEIEKCDNPEYEMSRISDAIKCAYDMHYAN